MEQILLSFSVKTNGAKLMDTESSKKEFIQVLHGLRFFSNTWVILCHIFMLIPAMLTLREYEAAPCN